MAQSQSERIAELEAALAAETAAREAAERKTADTDRYTVRLHKGAAMVGPKESRKPGPNRNVWYLTVGGWNTSIGNRICDGRLPTVPEIAAAIDSANERIGKLADCMTGVTTDSVIAAANAAAAKAAESAAPAAPAAPAVNGSVPVLFS